MNAEEIDSQYPGYEIEGRVDKGGWWGSQPRETLGESRQRAEQQARRLLTTFSSDQRVACVIHADFKALMLQFLLEERWHPLADEPLYNTGVTWLRCEAAHVDVIHFNDVAHLPSECLSD